MKLFWRIYLWLFATAVAAFLLVRMERRLEELSLAIRDLHAAIISGRTLSS